MVLSPVFWHLEGAPSWHWFNYYTAVDSIPKKKITIIVYDPWLKKKKKGEKKRKSENHLIGPNLGPPLIHLKTFQNLDQPVECSFAGCPWSRQRPNVLTFCANQSGRRLDLFTSILLFWQYIFLMVFLVKHWMSLLKWCFLQYFRVVCLLAVLSLFFLFIILVWVKAMIITSMVMLMLIVELCFVSYIYENGWNLQLRWASWLALNTNTTSQFAVGSSVNFCSSP